jgi:hypothetical protein
MIGALASAPCFKPPKTDAGRRVVKLSADVSAALREHGRAEVARQLAAAAWAEGDLVFCTGAGKPLNPNNLYSQEQAMQCPAQRVIAAAHGRALGQRVRSGVRWQGARRPT